MMQAIAKRRFSSGGKTYDKGKTFAMNDGQFADWKAAGLVEEAPVKQPRKGK